MLRPPGGGTGVELATFVRPDHQPGSPAAMANELGRRSICFQVEDLQAIVDGRPRRGTDWSAGSVSTRQLADGPRPRPEGIVVSVTERIG